MNRFFFQFRKIVFFPSDSNEQVFFFVWFKRNNFFSVRFSGSDEWIFGLVQVNWFFFVRFTGSDKSIFGRGGNAGRPAPHKARTPRAGPPRTFYAGRILWPDPHIRWPAARGPTRFFFNFFL